MNDAPLHDDAEEASRDERAPEATGSIRAFVQLAYGFGAETWRRKQQAGTLVGLNEPLAYGYHRAQEANCEVVYSRDHDEGFLGQGLRYALRGLLGFDLLHAWRNRQAMREADVVWTHTESQSLAVSAILKLHGAGHRPRTVLQSVWLVDRWPKTHPLRRAFYRWLLREGDVLTFLSVANAAEARQIFPGSRIERIHFGIAADSMVERNQSPAHRPIRVLSVGNDPQRDWATLRDAVRGAEHIELRVVTQRLPADYFDARGAVVTVKDNKQLLDLYDWADLMVTPIRPNLHASGITVIEEAIIRGLAVVCTQTGGLEDYFDASELRYIPPGDPAAMREAIEALAVDVSGRAVMVAKAQERIRSGGLNSRAYALRHAELSRELLGPCQNGPVPTTSATDWPARRAR